ncbi:MAG TPA: ATP-binding protein [Aggregatilineales bacterium]|nr:GAF domain-containing protein [Anaerolineales bacterium]HRE47692.1 ATP-binding protein [Aggregatilineales bacterium]
MAQPWAPPSESKLLRAIALAVGGGIAALLVWLVVVLNTTDQGTRETVLEQYYRQQTELLTAITRQMETNLLTLAGDLTSTAHFFSISRSDTTAFSELSAVQNRHLVDLNAVVRLNADGIPIQAFPPPYQGVISDGIPLPWRFPNDAPQMIRSINGPLLTREGSTWLMIAPIYTNRQTFSGYVVGELRWEMTIQPILNRLATLGQGNVWFLPNAGLNISLSPDEEAIRAVIMREGDSWGRRVIRDERTGEYLNFAPVLAGNSIWWLAVGTSEAALFGRANTYLNNARGIVALSAAGIALGGVFLLIALRRLHRISLARLKVVNHTLRLRASQLEKSTHLSRDLSATLSMDVLCERAIQKLRSTFEFYHVALYVLMETTLVLRNEDGIPLPPDRDSVFPLTLELQDQNLNSKAARERRTIRVNDVRTSPDYVGTPATPDIRSELILPLMVEDQVVGMLDIASDMPNAFGEEDAMLFQGLANQLAIALRNAELYESAQQAQAEAETSNLLKSRFLANMSHELRTPLNSIIGYTELMVKQIYGTITPQQQNRLEKVLRNGQSLLALINDILDLSKIEAGRIELRDEPLDPVAIAKDVAATVLPLAEQNGNTFDLRHEEAIPTLHADTARVRQILFNLLSNAAKFTQSGKIALDIRRETDDDGVWVVFEVSDTGIGISQDHLPMLFKEFQQIDGSATRKYGGTGLGLAISRRFCRMMGGDVMVSSELGVGSVFTARLPVRPPQSVLPVRDTLTGEKAG